MVQILLIGVVAGAAAALLFASVASGSLFSVLLFYLSPLPIMIAAIGWSQLAALIAAVVAAATLGLVLDGYFFAAFLIGIGLPAWWLGYLVLMARAGTSDTLEWYPIDHLVMWAAGLGALVVTIAIFNFGTDAESVQGALRTAFERILRMQTRTPAGAPLEIPGLSDPSRVLNFLVAVIPPTAAALTTFTSLLNLWLAGRILKLSGRLKRPWPDLAEMRLPSFAPVLLAVALAASFSTGLAGIIAQVTAASFMMAYAVLGFAVLHMITRGLNARGFILAGAYAAVLLFGWPVLALMLLGLLDAALNLRGRVAKKQRPPPPAI